MDFQRARTAQRWDVSVLMLAALLATSLAIGATGLRTPSARAYALLGPKWANQPSPHTCCAQLGVAVSAIQGYDQTGWFDGMNGWNGSPADILWHSADSTIYATDTYDSSTNADGWVNWQSLGNWLIDADGYLNSYYTANYVRKHIQALATHELGHMAGLDDVSTNCVIMNGTQDTYDDCYPSVYTPQQDDINGIDAMY